VHSVDADQQNALDLVSGRVLGNAAPVKQAAARAIIASVFFI
jgi:hypothetical protein